MLVVAHEGTYELERDAPGSTVERPCPLSWYGAGRAERGGAEVVLRGNGRFGSGEAA